MPNVNKANRQVCDLYIDDYKTNKPVLDFDTANTTTIGLTSESVYARAKGSKRIVFNNPIDGTITIEAQVMPFKYYALFSDGTIDTSAIYADRQTVKCTTAGEIALTAPTNGTIKAGTVFVYPADSFGDNSAAIEGTFATNKFTATTAEKIALGTEYTIGYLVERSGVKKVSFNNKKMPKDYKITMSTVDKGEDGLLTPFIITVYKATIQKNFELSFSSDGDPATVTATFDIMEDKDGNVVDMVELPDNVS